MRRAPALPAAIAALLAFAGCADDQSALEAGAGAAAPTETSAAAPAATPTAADVATGPLSFDNCGDQVTIDETPQRVVILSGNAVPLLSAVDALDRVVARGGEFSGELYDPATREVVESIPALSEEKGETGGVVLSLEVLLDQDPDLVIGYATQAITRQALGDAGVPLLVQPGFCDGPTEPDVGFSDVYAEVELYGRIFDAQEQAAASVAGLRERVAAVEAASAPADEGGSVALLYLNESGGALSAYGNRGIVHDQLQLAGMTNAFADVEKRVFDIGIEELLGRDPDRLIILRAVDADAQTLTDALRSIPGAEQLTAVRNDALSTQIFDYGDPPTPLSVQGLELLADEQAPA